MPDQRQTLLYETISSFATLSAKALSLFFNAADIQWVKKRENLLSEGEYCKSIFFIESGFLRTFARKDGTEINIDFAFEGSFVTSLKSLRNGSPSEVNIQAGEDSNIYYFEKSNLLTLYSQSPELESMGRNIIEHLLIAQEDHSKMFKIASPAERYEHLRAHHPQIMQRVSLSQIASYLGVTRETVTRIRKMK
jgi:CRP-like cAMP-binding protein